MYYFMIFRFFCSIYSPLNRHHAGLLCKFICKAPVSGTKQLDNHHFVGNATGIMPV